MGMRHGTNTEALGDHGAAGAAAMNADGSDRHGGQTELRPTCERSRAETLRRDCVSDLWKDTCGRPTSPSSRGLLPGPQGRWLSGLHTAGLVSHTLLGCGRGLWGSRTGHRGAQGTSPTEDTPEGALPKMLCPGEGARWPFSRCLQSK